MKLEHYLVEEKEKLLQQKAEIDTELENAPPGKIQIAKSKESYRWRQLVLVPKKSKPVRTEIRKKDRDVAEQLCNKQYLLEQKQIIQKRLELIDRFLHDFPFRDDITLSSVHPEFLSLLNSYRAKNQDEYADWAKMSYEQNAEHPEGRTIPTKAGVKVRSKSEAIIANLLTHYELPFRYEQVLNLSGFYMHPDFTILHPRTHTLIIWEHFGMLDSDSYVLSASKKYAAYLSAGYIPGKNLILTYENKEEPFNIRYAEHLLCYYFS